MVKILISFVSEIKRVCCCYKFIGIYHTTIGIMGSVASLKPVSLELMNRRHFAILA